MKKIVVISSTENDEYLFFVPLITWAWNKLGWDVLFLMVTKYGDQRKRELVHDYMWKLSQGNIVVHGQHVDQYRDETVSQVSRLYVASLYSSLTNVEGDYLMTSDADMLPLSDYWEADPDEITCWGRDLTDYHYPICYIGMTVEHWKSVMGINGQMIQEMVRELNSRPKASSDKWEEWWQVDQDIITEKLADWPVKRIDRGIAPNSHYPLGRIDRGAWELTHFQPERIDAHLLRPGYTTDNFTAIMELIDQRFTLTDEEADWMNAYRNKYIKLIG